MNMVVPHSLGFPRIGAKREMKFAVESFWKGELNLESLIEKGKLIRRENWSIQKEAGLDLLPVGDFSWYDHVLDMSALLGVIPNRYQSTNAEVSMMTYFQMARGEASAKKKIQACEMTKWFDTNYHYIVPELHPDLNFKISSSKLFDEIDEAKSLGYRVKPILLGPLSYLWLSKTYPKPFDKLTLLPRLIKAYQSILAKLQAQHIEWVQIDEPILVLDLPLDWKGAFQTVYQSLQQSNLKILLTTYFGGLEDNLDIACQLPVAGLHIDAVRSPQQVSLVLQQLRSDCILSVGIINGRNIWKTDLQKALHLLKPIQQKIADRLWIGGSCSFLHCPVDLDGETNLNKELILWLAFAKQKTKELVTLSKGLNEGDSAIAQLLHENQLSLQSKSKSSIIHNSAVKARCEKLKELSFNRTPFKKRQKLQRQLLKLPLLTTTTIGSFPQTPNIRKLRHDYKTEKISLHEYEDGIKREIREVIARQEELELDVFVHGEPERNDMVEYFGEQLGGFAFTQNGWVQSFGSRCVKPPIIYGDVSRPKPMTVDWSRYAQSLTNKLVKGMLTGPVTIVMWSFIRDDQPWYITAQQIGLVLQDEVSDLEKAGIHVIQIDEPAFREGLPLRKQKWQAYLKEAVYCFKLVSSHVADSTQIHTHMCYSEFNDIIAAIADLDADVISIETSRSHMEILEAFKDFAYPNEIGPGVYDIHSPRIPTIAEMKNLIDKAALLIPVEQLWINPDCGLKTRTWNEVMASLKNMVEAAKELRKQYTKKNKKELI